MRLYTPHPLGVFSEPNGPRAADRTPGPPSATPEWVTGRPRASHSAKPPPKRRRFPPIRVAWLLPAAPFLIAFLLLMAAAVVLAICFEALHKLHQGNAL